MRTNQLRPRLHLVGNAIKSSCLEAERMSFRAQCEWNSAKRVVAPLGRRPNPSVGSGPAIAVEHAQRVQPLRDRSEAGSPTT